MGFEKTGRVMSDMDPAVMAQMEKEGVGPFLRRVREAEDVSLRAISDQTRIRVHYLESIESGSFDRLPMGPIGVGFVRAFAEAVGVDAGAAAAAFKREAASGLGLSRQESESGSAVLFRSSRRQGRVNSVAALLLILLFLLAGGGVLWFVKGKTTGPLASVELIADSIKTAFAPATDDAPPPQAKKAALGKAGEEKARAPASGAMSAPPTVNAAPAALPLALRIFAVEHTWLRIVVDAKDAEEFLLEAGGERNWRASEKFVLTLGNVAGAQVSLNGEKIALPRTNVLRDFTITRQSLN